ncbi:MAG: SDR family oxidoreductase [Firmicutes bacterium]|nr:SDR family oxidoreductase [Bacillota bacterium]
MIKLKTVLITGGTKGIGKSIAIKFAQNNYNLVLNYLSDSLNAENLKKELENKYNVNVTLIKTDISSEEEVIKLSNEINNIDILINNAGIAIDTTVEDKTVENFKRILDVNLIGPFLTSKYIGKKMFDNKKGKIINISSNNSIDSYYPESMDYDASKAGLNIITKDFAKLYSPYVLVNAVAVGWTNTDMNKDMDIEYKKNEEERILLNRFANPEEIANVVYFLASDDSSYINSTIIKVDGGLK